MSPFPAPAALRRVAAGALVALTLPLADCVEKDDDALPTAGGGATAQLRIVHAIPDAAPVDVRLDDAAALVTGLAFRQATAGYLAVAAGDRRVRITASGASTPAVDATPTLAEGTATTLIATGLTATSTTQAIVVADTLTAPPSEQVRLRIVHAAPTAGLVDVYLSASGAALPTTPTLTALAYRTVANSITIPAGTYRVRLTPNGLRTPTVDVTTAALAAGAVAKLIAVDAPSTGGTATVIVVTDRVP
jgi:hypothetical protein